MGRPRNYSNEIKATEKIENAFWKILETEGFKSITILRLSQESGVNKNTIYYHYDNVEDVAQKAFEHNVNHQVADKFLSSILNKNANTFIDATMLQNIKRIHLLAKSESPFLHTLVSKSLIDTWVKKLNIDYDKLSDSELISIRFLSSGITSILGDENLFVNQTTIREFPFTALGQASIQTLINMRQKK